VVKRVQRAFITGAASGLGLELATQLAKANWQLGITDLREGPLEEASRHLQANGAVGVRSFCFDVGDRQAFEKAAGEYLEWSGGIDLLINNAGVGDGGEFHDYRLEDWEWLMQINFMGVVYGCHFFVPRMRTQRSGRIVNIASAAGFANGPGMSAYNASKAAVRSLSETLRYELAEKEVTVSVVMPTFFKTNVMQFARGPQSARNFAAKMIDRSNLEAKDVAREILARALKGEPEIVLPQKARRLFLIKRLFPRYYARKTLARLAAIKSGRL
jgi:short-subunit dehydrogenase